MKRMLADVCPELINEWSQRNLPLTPESVTHGSNKIVWWNGKCGHEWRASIKNRVISGSGCPYCSHNAILEGYNDLASQKPDVLEKRPMKDISFWGYYTPYTISYTILNSFYNNL